MIDKPQPSSGAKLGLWIMGLILVIILLEFIPRVGGAVLMLLTVYLASTLLKKGVV